MKTNQHMEKARRILVGLAKLDPANDALALIDGTMVAGYHMGNAALHAHSVTDPSVHFNTPSKFEIPPDSLPAALKLVYEVFEELEQLRSHYVRGRNQPDTQAGIQAQQLLARMARLCGA